MWGMCTAQSITQTMMDPEQFCESGRLHTGPHNRNPLSEGQRGMTGEGKVAQQINEIAIQFEDTTLWSKHKHLSERGKRDVNRLMAEKNTFKT